ncbi:A-kinase anchor protein 10, mitochondrial-like [Aedes aegypti]|uniref:Uncharacterized protein n=1 Tax=Aedes aegypti TaxID=7159 RepID=A0A6I8TYA7_AEDAE|nr:A-kinase anchor protein 10, mitochondrial-like [Aedes aegypti]
MVTVVPRKNSITGSNSSNSLAHQEPSSKATSADDVIDSGGANHSGEPANDEQALQEAEQLDNPTEVRSRLSRNLHILAEQSCICYFVQYLETKEALALVKFLLDVESFKAAASADNARVDGGNGTGKDGRISLALCGGTCSERIFDDAQQYLLEAMEKSYLNAFLESSFYSKYTFEVLSSDSLTLKDILCSEMALFYFMEYLEQKGKRYILEFCVTVSHFRRSTENSQGQEDAVVLYEKYYSLQATCPLKVSDKIRFLVEEGICSPEAGMIKNCFEIPSRIIERFLEKRYFQGFLKS